MTVARQVRSRPAGFPCAQFIVSATYEATIRRPDGSTCTDRGNALANVGSAAMSEGFASSPGDAVSCTQALPATKAGCNDPGWQSDGVFKNHGDCVSFVATGGGNGPAGP